MAELQIVEPPRATVIGWLKLNLALTMFVISIVSAIGGALTTATWQIADTTHAIADANTNMTRVAKESADLRIDLTDLDRRLTIETINVLDMRRTRDMEVAALSGRVAVLEAQVHFFADRFMAAKPIGPR
jgi:hypothetical protein